MHPQILSLLLLAAPPAHAEYWGAPAGAFLQTATVIAYVRPDVDGLVVTRPLRGTTAGAILPVPSFPSDHLPAEILAICDAAMCPRAIGVPMEPGFWRLIAYEPGDGAMVSPGFLTEVDLLAVLRGEPMGTLCIEATVSFIETPEHLSLRGVISTADGTGQLTLDGQPWTGTFLYGEGWMSRAPSGASIRLDSQTFMAQSVSRNADGCLTMEVTPAQPLSRSKKQVQQVLTGAKVEHTLATGTVVIEGQVYPTARLVIDAQGQLVFSGVPGAMGSISMMMSGPWPLNLLRIGFGDASESDRILFGVPVMPQWMNSSIPAHMAQVMVDGGGGMTWPVYRGDGVVGAAAWRLAPVD